MHTGQYGNIHAKSCEQDTIIIAGTILILCCDQLLSHPFYVCIGR